MTVWIPQFLFRTKAAEIELQTSIWNRNNFKRNPSETQGQTYQTQYTEQYMLLLSFTSTRTLKP